MPIFEYLCPACGEQQELLVSSAGADRSPPCPACAAAMEKQLSVVAAHTKGAAAGCAAGAAAGCAASRGGFS